MSSCGLALRPLAAACNLPLPERDGLIEAERRVHGYFAEHKPLNREFDITAEIEQLIGEPLLEPVRERLLSSIEETASTTMAGVVVKLRHLCDERTGSDDDVVL